ncbi:Endonuclease/exonuclease/phosphatase [Hyaloraphidium curvatum]|nr:Endonuclease/exonuclease/phosphatase [Hyaloraphidium curvatum]
MGKGSRNVSRTPEEIERIRSERAAARALPKPPEPKIPVFPRKLIPTRSPSTRSPALTFSFLSFNILAQCLVRRELYPFANPACLRQKYRFDRILAEIEERAPTVMALQEVDNFESVVRPGLKAYDTFYSLKAKVNEEKDVYANGQASGEDAGGHGLLIAWKRDSFTREKQAEVRFDGHRLTHPTPVRPNTHNIAQIAALRSTTVENWGLIVANLHLFWRPTAKYERARQAYVLLSEVLSFRDSLDPNTQWTTLLSGDFNTVPSSVLYRALTRTCDFSAPERRAEAVRELEPHITAFGVLGVNDPAEDEPEQDSAYPPNPLPPNELLSKLEAFPLRLESAYQDYMVHDPRHSRDPRWNEAEGWRGEPVYSTSCLFSGTLDYIFVIRENNEDDKPYRVTRTSVLEVPPVEVVLNGIPNEDFPSDHIPIMAEFAVEDR